MLLKKIILIIGVTFLYFTADAQWNSVNTGLENHEVTVLAHNERFIFAATNSGLYRVSVNDTTWMACHISSTADVINCVAINSNYVFVGTNNGVFVSTNNGLDWKSSCSGLLSSHVNFLTVSGNYIFASTDAGVFLSTNNGVLWTSANWGLTHLNAYSCTVSHSVLFVGSCGVYMSKDNGLNWDDVSTGLPDFTSNSLITCNNYVYVATSGGGVYRRQIDEMLIPNQLKSTFNNLRVKVYPNPFSTSTTLEIINESLGFTSNNHNYELFLYDITGKEINRFNNFINNKIIIEKGSMHNGIYFYQLSVENRAAASGKFIIE